MPDEVPGCSGTTSWKCLGRRILGLMAVNLLMPLLIPLGEQITNVTHLSNVGNLAFQQPWMEVFVKENTAPALLLTLHASTNSSTKSVFYSIVSGGLNGLFLVDPHSGHLTLAAPLDYETKNSYELIVGAICGEERAFAQVVVKVRDVNDLPPTFPRPLFETQITEEDDRHLPKPILQVAANDGDVSDTNRLQYSLHIEDSPESTDIFTITNNTGHLYLLKALNRDAPDGRPRWHLRVTVTDGLHTAQALIHVNVKDINDNSPYFPHDTINATVMENSRTGVEILRVTALDNDDPEEGTNAVLSYFVEKNVIDEHSGQHIFNIESQSGRLFTAQCCLDRERTPFYAIQVVAADGGGLKGTGTVVVSIGDQNDVPPRFSRSEWLLTIHETVPLNTTLALLTVEDPDITNDFAFRIVPGSGYGWERFHVVPVGDGSGALQILRKLDFEDPKQRRGFKFKVQVTDKGEKGWDDDAHRAETWVIVEVVDDNDNPPRFSTRHINLTLPEDTPAGLSLTTLSASDADKGLAGNIHYTVDTTSDPGRQFAVDNKGAVRLRRPLDREKSALHLVRILAVDEGQPPLTATSSVLITVTDINDNPPRVANPDAIFVPENSNGPMHVASLELDDDDDWALGHGPPFTVSLDKNSPKDIKESFSVKFNNRGHEKGGIVVVTSLKPLDREASPLRLVPLVMADAEGLTTTATITVTVGDVNDNPMKPAAKVITVKKFVDGNGMMMIGRVFVDDPDDWDGGQKIWTWKNRHRHHLFSLEENTGRLSMHANTTDGRYLLQFLVSDPVHKQVDVPANVTVTVASYSRDIVNCAVPITITTHTPIELIAKDQPTTRSPIERLTASVESVANVDVEALSLEAKSIQLPNAIKAGTRVWLTSRLMNPLDQLLLLHRLQISNESGVGIVDVGVGVCVSIPPSPAPAKVDYMWVVDANSTALVTPRLVTFNSGCSCQTKPEFLHHHHHHHSYYYQHHSKSASTNSSQAHVPNVAAVTHSSFCLPNPCLNGGRCIPSTPTPRCVCPEGTTGSVCKQLSRNFAGKGWIWVVPIPAVSQVHISIEFKTTRKECLLLYAGPRDDQNRHMQEDVLSLELRDGRPRMLLDLGTGPVSLSLSDGQAMNDGRWHRLDIFWRNQRAELVSDLCQFEKAEFCQVRVPLPSGSEVLDVGAPLHVGGLTHPPPHYQDYSWPHPITSISFAGCLRNLRVNGELRDLGEGVLGEDSHPGCPKGDQCQEKGNPCPLNARCVTSESGEPVCECNPGWTTSSCNQKTKPASFNANSYVRVALSSTPAPNTTTLRLRFRTWEQFGQMLAVSSQHGKDALTLQLVKGRLCVQLLLHPKAIKLLCLQKAHLNDGQWHNVRVDRFGEWMELRVDDGDGPLYNSTVTPATKREWLTQLRIDRQEGIHVGGSPDYIGVSSIYTVLRDFHNGCLDDLRISGWSLPLPPLENNTEWAQATMFANIHEGCHGGVDVCANVSCPNPFTCIDLWRRHHCGCDEGTALSQEGDFCRDINECLGNPCLNGGTCINRDPGYFCECPDSHIGDHCEGRALPVPSLATSVGIFIMIFSWTLLFMAIGVAIWILRRRCQQRKSDRRSSSTGTSLDQTDVEETQSERITIAKIISLNGKFASKSCKTTVDVDVLSGSRESGGGLGKGCECSHRDPSDSVLYGKKAAVGDSKTSDKVCGCHHLSSADDLRYYAYEGEGSSPGSLSSCCSGGDGDGDQGFLAGFQDVASLLNCLSAQPMPQSPTLRQKGLSSNGSSQELSQRPSSSSFLPASKRKNSSLHSVTTDISQCVPDITASVIHTADVIVSQKGQQKREIGVIPRRSNNSSFFDDKSCDVHGENFDTGSKSSQHKRCNSLPRCRVPAIFVNNLHGDGIDPSRYSVRGYHYSLDRRKASAQGYGARRMSSDELDGNQKKEKCSACVKVLLQQRESVFGTTHFKSFSTSTVSFLSYSGDCSQMVPEVESTFPASCPLHGCSSSLKKKHQSTLQTATTTT
ncbi:putative neural-cadherin 2 [Macrobrachium rosenbergii]|uniref:putative neural-cadherin 2 n=1 Tax=Macrobrachium rosenbergii TaxID=79674 RepID=UPI0034D43CE5